MKLWEVMRLLEENPADVYEARLNKGWKVRMTVEKGFSEYYKFEVFNGKKLMDQSLGGGRFNGNVALELDWQLVRQSVPWQEALQAWADGKKISFSYMGYDNRFDFEDCNNTMSVDKIKKAEWYVED